MDVLFLVNSAFQMITAIQLRITTYRNDNADIIITDNLTQYEGLSVGVEKSGVFRNVSTMRSKDYDWKNWKFSLLGTIFDKEIKNRIPNITTKCYNVFLFCNFSGVSACVGAYFRRVQQTELIMFEDGFASYSDFWLRGLKRAIYPSSVIDKLVYGLVKRTPYYITKYFVYNPELIADWKFEFSVEKIERINTDTVKALNDIFQYDASPDDYSNVKCIFFEESYYADGIDIGDIDIVEQIANIVGKENMMVKIHPRNPENRFGKLGFKTNIDTVIPWEVIALNSDLSDTILITIASGSSITAHFISGASAKMSILLYGMEGIDKTKLTPSTVVFDKICRNDNYFVYPKNFEELKIILQMDAGGRNEHSSNHAN